MTFGQARNAPYRSKSDCKTVLASRYERETAPARLTCWL
jgi:hypothetical protein